jgi:uncharacterized phage protein (TIGR02220 family)
MKESYYFSHDSNATNDPKILVLLAELGMEGYGIYWTVIEHLREQPNYVSNLNVLKGLAMRYGTSREKYLAVVKSYELFQIKDDLFFWSESLIDRMRPLELQRENNKKAGIQSGIARKLKSKQLQLEMNNCSTSKVKERKVKEIKEEIPDLADRVLSYLFQSKKNILKGSKPFLVTEARRKLIRKRVKDSHGMRQFQAVIDYKIAEWIHDHGMSKYLVPETLFSDKFDKYLDQARDNYANKELDPYRNDKHR